MDQIDWKIIEILQKNARITFSQLSIKVHLTAPAVSERILKMEEKGIINEYIAKLNLEQLGYNVICFAKIDVARNWEEKFIQFCRSHDEIIECYIVTGKSSFLLKVGAPNVETLELYLKKISDFGQTHTQSQIILEEVFKDKVVRKRLLKV
jgi:Lrp/AsnC family leucine-responsive transcriptional regulator